MPSELRLRATPVLRCRGVIAFVCAAVTASQGWAGEVLYNGIELPGQWPPEYDRNPREPMPTPYLEDPPAVIPIDVGRQLLVDDFLIEKTTLKRAFHTPEYHPANPVLKPDKPWENKSVGWFASPFSGGAWYDPADRLFKLWYTGGFLSSTCYATSRDGIRWEKPALDVESGTNIVLEPVKTGRRRVDTTTVWLDLETRDSKQRFKYFATEAGGGWGMTYRTSSGGWDADAATGLAILRRDGFASMDAGRSGGTLTTRPMTFKGSRLFVNVDCPEGALKAEALDTQGRVVEPFSAENCTPLATDGTRAAVTWKATKDLSALAGKPVRFRFHLTNGSLYAFWVSPDKSGASHGYVAAGGPGFTGPTDTVGGKGRLK